MQKEKYVKPQHEMELHKSTAIKSLYAVQYLKLHLVIFYFQVINNDILQHTTAYVHMQQRQKHLNSSGHFFLDRSQRELLSMIVI